MSCKHCHCHDHEREEHEDECACEEGERGEGAEIEKEDRKHFWITVSRLVVSLVLALLGLFLFNEEWGDAHLGAGNGVWLNFGILLASWLIAGYDIVFEGVESAIKEHNPFDENVLMIIASIGAFSLRFFGPSSNEFFEAVMIVLLYQVGEMFEDFATERSHKAINEALGLRAKTANLLVDGKLQVVDPKTLKIHDKILIKVGEIVPSDGIVIEGKGELDMSSLTGEFLPVAKKEGDLVNSGTILKTGSLVIEVSKAYEDSTVSKILELVAKSEKEKSKADRFITRFARFYTPIVVSIAILLAIIPPLFLGMNDGSVWSHWIYTAVCLLVISCPCAVVVSVPLSYFAGIGLASKRGILVKGATYFDKLNALETLVTDKTGTLTYGRFAVTEKVPYGISEEDFDRFLIASEAKSNHPIAKAVVSEHSLDEILKDIQNYEELAGFGSVLDYQGHHLLAGNHKLLEKEGVAAPKLELNGTIVYLAVNGKYAGYVLLNDQVRKESPALIEGLRKQGVKTLMLTGDKEGSAATMAKGLGISEYHSELLPSMKTDLLRERIAKANAKNGAVAYLGDGINDAPSIALADVGIAMGGAGSDMAIENANIVLMNDDPSKVVTALKIAKKTRARAITDIVIALTVKFLVALLTIIMPYIAGGAELPMFIAVLCDTGLTAALILYSVTLLWTKRV